MFFNIQFVQISIIFSLCFESMFMFLVDFDVTIATKQSYIRFIVIKINIEILLL
jgi:hypothetical protein